MILLSWNTAWWFIWDATTAVNWNNPIEKLFVECKNWSNIPNLLSEIGSQINSKNFLDKWAHYCHSTTTNFQVDSNTQHSINVERLLSKINLDEKGSVTYGTNLHSQDFSNLCHSFAIVTSLRRELVNVTEKCPDFFRFGSNYEPVVKPKKDLIRFSKFLIDFVVEISPRSLHGLAGQNSNQQEISAQFCDLEKAIRRLVYPTRAFNEEGWKRMSWVTGFFRRFGLEVRGRHV